MAEPKIISEGMTNEEIFEWMKNKTKSAGALRAALAEKQGLEQALAEVESRIQWLTSDSAVEVVQEYQGSTQHQ
ncbi:TPA: hypothetical protein ACQZHX_002481 [Enterobacter sichuanensis]